LVDDPGLERHRDRDEFDPIFWAHNGTVIAVDWAEGFLHAIMLRMDAWDRLLKSKRDGQLLIPILALCGDENGDSLLDLTPDEEDRFMEQAPELIPACVIAIAEERDQSKLAENLVVTTHDGAEDGIGLVLVGKLRRFAIPDQRQPFARQNQFRPDCNPGEEAVEIGQHHAVWRRTVGHQEAIKRFQIDLGRGESHEPVPGRALRLANRAHHHGMQQSRGQAVCRRDP
jgi:hypothetical protein